MIELFLVVTTLNATPKIDVFQTEQAACVSFEDQPSNASAHIFKETIDRHDKAEIKEGVCKPLKQFIGVRKE